MYKVSLVIPTKNEEKFISKVIDSLINQDYPKEDMEILIVDGMSSDNTKNIVKEYQKKYNIIKLLDNPKIYTPFAFNIGIKNSSGDAIAFMGAHTTYSSNYVSTIAKYLSEGKAECVGSILQTLPRINTSVAKSISFSLNSIFGTGNSYMRIGSKKPIYADTAGYSGYKKEVFEKIGLFNENLVRSQDMEFNIRLRKAGGRILLVPEIVSYYYPSSNLKEFFRHNFDDGFWAIYPLKFVRISFRPRHYIPLIFIGGLLVIGILWIFTSIFSWLFLSILGLYLLLSLYFSYQIVIKEKKIRYLFLMPIAFVCRHFGYGLGSVYGLIINIISKQFWKNLKETMIAQ